MPGGNAIHEGVTTTLAGAPAANRSGPALIAAALVGASAVTALMLGVFGLYGAMADAARQRQREIAVRIALGAQGWRVIREVLAEGATLAGAGTAAGMVGFDSGGEVADAHHAERRPDDPLDLARGAARARSGSGNRERAPGAPRAVGGPSRRYAP